MSHPDADTEYVELKVRGKAKEYFKNLAAASVDPLRKGSLEAAQKILFEKNTTRISLTEIANELGITHVALYRHFANKDDLWLSLAKHWLTGTERHLTSTIVDDASREPLVKLHAWLMALAQTKQETYRLHPALFSLYTDMVRAHPDLEAQHLRTLQTQILSIAITGNPTENDLSTSQAILDAFTVFYDPRFKRYWSCPQMQARQETVWELVSPALRQWII